MTGVIDKKSKEKTATNSMKILAKIKSNACNLCLYIAYVNVIFVMLISRCRML